MTKEQIKIITENKIINAWSVTRDNSNHPIFKNASKGDIAFIYNDFNGKRQLTFIPSKDLWYFYIENNQKNIEYIENLNLKYKIGKNWIRIYIDNYEYRDENIKKLVLSFENNGIKTFEADVSPMKRVCLDYDVKVEDFDKIRVLYFDIETDDSKGEIEIGRDQILSFAGVDQNGKKYYLSNKNEYELLTDINNLILKFDMLVGWNSYQFDLPYLKARFKKFKIPGDYLYNVLHEDMMKRVFYFYSKEPVARQEISSYSLEYISQYFLKEGKIKHTEKIIELFNKNPEKLKEYNIHDAVLLHKLEQKLGTIKHTYRLFQMCQVFAQNWSMVKSIDNFILVDANKKGIHFKTNLNAFKNYDENDDISTEYVGALVLTPKPGYYKDVYDLDFRSLYPNIIRTFNISPETLNLAGLIHTPIMEIDGKKHGGHVFLAQEGIIPGKIGILLDERNKLKKTLKNMDPDSQEYKSTFANQWVTKDLANSFYGVLGNKYFREFNINMSEAITVTGQYLLTWVADYLNKTGRKSLYGDTDSVFAQFKENEKVEDVLKEINEEMTKHLKLKYNVKNSTVELGFDCKFDHFIIEAKKKYAGLVDGKLRQRGMESVKRDTIPLAVKFQKELLKKIFEGKSETNIVNTIKKWKKQIETDTIKVEDITIRKRINKNVKSYKSKPLHVILAEAQGHNAGEIVQYIITNGAKEEITPVLDELTKKQIYLKSGKPKMKKNIRIDGITIDEFNGNFDRKYYWNNSIYPMLEKILVLVFQNVYWDKFYIN